MGLRVAVVHDYLTQRGGAERVAMTIHEAFPGSRMITSLYEPLGTFPEFQGARIETSRLQRFEFLRRDPRRAFPFLRSAFDAMPVRGVDVVVCSSTGFAHGIPADAPKIVYCHNPPRWLYQPDDYTKGLGLPVRGALALLRPGLLRWDQAAAASAARYLVNSTVVKERVRRAYGIEAMVVPPPVALDAAGDREPVPGIEPGFFLTIGRARGYKNIEVVREAFRHLLSERLVIVGAQHNADLDEPWPPNVTGLVGVSDEQLRWLYASCSSTISASHEDFGLTPIEGYAFGKPTVVLRAGGFLDTTIEGVTGTFIESLDPAAVTEAIERHLKKRFVVAAIVQHILTHYTRDVFHATLLREVDAVLA